MRLSKQRNLILDIINNSCDHLNTDEIYGIAKENIPSISLGTVYRNINQLVLDNKIIRIKTNEGLDRYDNLNVKHHHFICSNCNKIIDVFDRINFDINNVDGNQIDDFEVKFVGICNDCKQGGKNGTKRN